MKGNVISSCKFRILMCQTFSQNANTWLSLQKPDPLSLLKTMYHQIVSTCNVLCPDTWKKLLFSLTTIVKDQNDVLKITLI